MNRLGLWILCLGMIGESPAQSRYEFGDTLYNWASALNIRAYPEPQAAILGKVPFGGDVIIADTLLEKIAMVFKALEPPKAEEFSPQKPFFLKGYWVKVHYAGISGYVFDGYLSKIKPIPMAEEDVAKVDLWALQVLGLTGKKTILPQDESTWTEYRGKDDRIRVKTGYNSKSGFSEIRIRNISMNEACMIGIKGFEARYLTYYTENQVIFKSSIDLCEIEVQKKGAWTIIRLSCSC